MEHCTTREAVEAVNECGPNVVGTITAHHLYLVVDDWADDPFCYWYVSSDVFHIFIRCSLGTCVRSLLQTKLTQSSKPVAKWPSDREALIKAVVSGTGKFFFGSDSAPHPIAAKKGGRGKTAAGVFTQPYCTQLVLGALEQAIERKIITEDEVTEEILKGFLGDYGRKFYGISDSSNEKIVLRKGGEVIQESITGEGVEVVPFRKGQSIWSIEWK